MAVEIIEALQNAHHNLGNIQAVGMGIVPVISEQLGNAIALLEKGYGIYEEVEPLIEQYGDIQSVPDISGMGLARP